MESKIITMDDYNRAIDRGKTPLSDWKNFHIDINLRIEIQNNLFGKSELGKGSVVKANDKYYHWCWENKLQVCEECCKPLMKYWSGYISHILTRGAHQEMAHDCRNSHILCGECHIAAENEETHRKMKIYEVDQIIIDILKRDY